MSIFFGRLGSFSTRTFSTSQNYFTKVALLGAAGGIGQPLSLLLKQSPYISSLALYDLKKIDGLALELDHIDTAASVHAFCGESQLHSCLDGAEIVIITAGIARKPGMERKDLFDVNARLVAQFAEQIVKSTFNPMIAVITNPVNSLVPVVAEVLDRHNMFDIRKLFGVTTLDIVRANSFYAQLTGLDPREVHVPVVAGHSGSTIVPLFSIAQPKPQIAVNFNSLIDKVRNAGTKVVEAKGGEGSATLSMAYSGFRFVTSLLQARLGKREIIEYGYVYAKYHGDVDFFSDPFRLTQEGVGEPVLYETITEAEKAMIMLAKEEIRGDIEMARTFVNQVYGSKKVKHKTHEVLGSARPGKIETSWVTDSNYDMEKLNEPIPKSKKGDAVPESEK